MIHDAKLLLLLYIYIALFAEIYSFSIVLVFFSCFYQKNIVILHSK